MILKVLLLIILIGINGIFSATEIAFLSLNKYDLNKEIKKRNKKAAKILNLLNDSSTFLSIIQIAITFSGFLASAFAAENFAGELSELIQISFLEKQTLTNILVVVITIVLSYFTLVFGELLPKKLGLAYSKKIAFSMVNTVDIVKKVFKPCVLLLKGSVDLLTKLFKIKTSKLKSEDEIKNSIEDSELEELEKSILCNVFDFDDTTIKQIMTEKSDMIAIDVLEDREKIIEKLKHYKYTRFPVIEDNKIIGLLNIKDMIINHQKEANLKKYIRKISSIESNVLIDEAFLILRSNHEMMAKVIENGECIGIITIEDIVEELVGEIYDEYN